jgi:DNA-binding XRE family transcriptional regulator
MMTGSELRMLRKKIGFKTQQALADALEVSRMTVIQLEKKEAIDRRTELAVIGLWAVRKRLDKYGYSR